MGAQLCGYGARYRADETRNERKDNTWTWVLAFGVIILLCIASTGEDIPTPPRPIISTPPERPMIFHGA